MNQSRFNISDMIYFPFYKQSDLFFPGVVGLGLKSVLNGSPQVSVRQ